MLPAVGLGRLVAGSVPARVVSLRVARRVLVIEVIWSLVWRAFLDGGIMVLDNSNRATHIGIFALQDGWEVIRFPCGFPETSLFIKPGGRER